MIGLVTDAGEVNDLGIDQDSWAGVHDAAKRIGATDPIALHSATTKLIADNVQSLIDRDAKVIVTVGYAADDWTVGFARSNPDIHFIGVDQGLCLTTDGATDDTGHVRREREQVAAEPAGPHVEAAGGRIPGRHRRRVHQ